MNEKEMLFCRYFAVGGNVREAAAKAGYRLFPEKAGLKLLAQTAVQSYLRSLREDAVGQFSRTGAQRLAFGSIADAVMLLTAEESPTREQLEQMDLFMVSEIKKPKGGGLEIKFFDRLKALELLERLEDPADGENPAFPFYKALQEGAEALRGEKSA